MSVSDKNRVILEGHRDTLVTHMKLSTLFWSHLVSKGCVTKAEKENIEKNHPVVGDRVSKLLEILQLKPERCIRKFIEALKLSHQECLADLLQREQVREKLTQTEENQKIPDIFITHAEDGSVPFFDQKAAIREKRENIMKMVNLETTALLEGLGTEGVFTEREVEMIRHSDDRRSDFVRLLHNKLNLNWGQFIDCLVKYDHSHLAKELDPARKMTTGDGVSRRRTLPFAGIQALLISAVLRLCGKIPAWSCQDGAVTEDIEKLDTFLLCSRARQDTTDIVQEDLDSYADIFPQVLLGKGIYMYLEGPAGSGKTTLMKRICYDWAIYLRSKLQCVAVRIQEKMKAVLSQFKFVLPIFMRDITVKSSFVDVLKRQFTMTTKDATELAKHIDTFQERTLIILEGFDEYPDYVCPAITAIAKRAKLPYVNILVTSRQPPSFHFDDIMKHLKFPDVQLYLKGFPEKSKKEYVEKFFHDSDGVETLLKVINDSDELKRLSRFPAVLLLICIVWSERKQLPDTVTGFYTSFVQCLCCKMDKRVSQSMSLETVMEIMRNELMLIGKVATEAFKKGQLSFPFDCSQSALSKTAWQLGFLIDQTGVIGEKLVTFPHKTLHEYFVSFYIVNCDPKTRRELLLLFFDRPDCLKDSSVLIKFVSGLGEQRVRDQLESVILGSPEDVAHKKTSLQLAYMKEHRRTKFSLPQIIYLDITHRDSVTEIRSYLFQDASDVREVIISAQKLHFSRLVTCLYPKDALRLRMEYSQEACPNYEKKASEHPLQGFSLQEIKIRNYKNRTESQELVSVANALCKMKRLESIDFAGTRVSEKVVPSIVLAIKVNKHLHVLRLRQCGLNDKSLEQLVKCFPSMPRLQTLDLSKNKGGKTVVEAFGELFSHLHHVSELRLFDLREGSIAPNTIKQLAEMKRMTVLQFGHHSLNNEGFGILPRSLEQGLKNTAELYLSMVLSRDVENAEWNGLFSTLSGLPNLSVLDLSNNNICAENMDTLITQLPYCSSLRALDMSNTHLVCDQVCDLIKAIPEPLKLLRLSNNQFGDNLQNIADLWVSLENLKELDLSLNKFSQETLERIITDFRVNLPGVTLQV